MPRWQERPLRLVLGDFGEVLGVIPGVDTSRAVIRDHAMPGHVGYLAEEHVHSVGRERVIGVKFRFQLVEAKPNQAVLTWNTRPFHASST